MSDKKGVIAKPKKTRRRVVQTESLQTRLEAFAKEARTAATLPAGPERDALLKKARQAETTSHIDGWVNSPGLKSPE
jgi:hypothetical protein